MEKRTVSKFLVRLLDSTVNLTVLVAFLILFSIGGYALWDSSNLYNLAEAKQYEMYKPTEEQGSLSFEELKEINPDVFGWLTVYGTHIDYPLVQAENNEKYINTNSTGEVSLSGSIFLDYRNNKDFKDFNNIIYGHHLDHDAMFGDIGNFKEENYFNNHKYGNLYYEGKNQGLEFVAFLLVDAYDSSVYIPPVAGEEGKLAYIKNLKEKAMYYRDIALTTDDHLVLLSTCTTDATNGRNILVARISSNVYQDSFQKDSKGRIPVLSGIDQQSIRKQLAAVPCWVWILLVLLFLLGIVSCHRIREKYKKRKKGQNGDDGKPKEG